MRRWRASAASAILMLLIAAAPVRAQQLVTVTMPASVGFQVDDVSKATAGTPPATQVSYSNALLFLPGQSTLCRRRTSLQGPAKCATYIGRICSLNRADRGV